jgi:hypothetical protein
MYDVEDGVHLAAAKRLGSSNVKNLALFNYHPSWLVKQCPMNWVIQSWHQVPALKLIVLWDSRTKCLRFKNKKLRSPGIQADDKEPNAIASAVIEADRSTEMYDIEDDVHCAAEKQLGSSGVKNLALFHYHPS